MMTPELQVSHIKTEYAPVGRWVPARVYAEIHGLSIQTLANWRYLDRKVGRAEAQPGYPVYRRFGAAVRYWLPAEEWPAA